MIENYTHTPLSAIPTDIPLGVNGIIKFSRDYNIPYEEAESLILNMENLLNSNQVIPFDMTLPENAALLEKTVSEYIDYFNKGARHDKQAYIIIGNIASGKNTFANQIEESTHSIIVDSDRFKMGELTDFGYFEGLTPLYNDPIDRERMQKPCSIASEKTLYKVADLDFNVILPRATKNMDKLNKETEYLARKGYDLHLILIDTPIAECADRNYYRYLKREYKNLLDANGKPIHGRFVPVSVIKTIGDNPFNIFVKSLGDEKYKSFSAYTTDEFSYYFHPINIETIQYDASTLHFD